MSGSLRITVKLFVRHQDLDRVHLCTKSMSHSHTFSWWFDLVSTFLIIIPVRGKDTHTTPPHGV